MSFTLKPSALFGCLPAALFIGLALAPATAAARDLSVSIDNDGVFLMRGWTRRVADTGTIFYTCVDDACGKGSIVSVRRQARATSPDSETLRQNEQKVTSDLQGRMQDKIDRIEIGEPVVVSNAQAASGEVARSIVPLVGADLGLHPFWKTGYVTMEQTMHTIASSANSRAASDANFAAAKFAIMLSGAGKSSGWMK